MVVEEFFDVVDDDDKVVGKTSRSVCHKKHLTHRSVMFFVFDKDKRVFVNKRSGSKEFFGGCRSLVFGGHVPSGESYDESAARELVEEAGLSDKLFRLGYFKKRLQQENENVMVYGVIASKPIKLLETEVVSGEFMTLKEAEKLIEKEEFIPETQQLLPILKEYSKRKTLD